MELKHLHYGWVTVIISTCLFAAGGIAVYTFGIFLIPLTTAFGWDRGVLSGAVSIAWLASGFLAILSGKLSDRYGPRVLVTISGLLVGAGFLLLSQANSLWQVYLSRGFLMGVAGAFLYTPVMSTIPRWFVSRRGLAIGIAATGMGIGGVFAPPLAQWLISTYDWRQAFFILGLIGLAIMVPLAQFMKHSPQRMGLKPYGEKGLIEDKQPSAIEGVSFKQAIKTSHFWLFGIILAGFFFCLQVIIVHIAPYAVDIGISETIAASIVSIIAGGSIIGRLSVGFISDRVGGRVALIACLIITTLALIWLIFAKEIWMFYIFAGVFGIAYGAIVPLEITLPVELFGLRSLGVILGGIMFISTIGGALGAPVAGSIFEVKGSYDLVLLVSVIVSALALILSLVLLRSKET